MAQATEKQVNYINILTNNHRTGIQSDWAFGGHRNAQRKALKAKYGNERLWDLTDAEMAQEWQTTVAGVLDYLDRIDQAAPTMSKAEASGLIDGLKNNSIVFMYWQDAGVL